jgi:aerobic carbon-monoxide dehydrogenase medium subunit
VKPARFDLARPASLAEAMRLLATERLEARVLAGGQSLGPMLNLRIAQPDLLVQVTHLLELSRVGDAPAAVTIGAAVTHAAIAAGHVPDIGHDVLARVASRIAYHAIRTRGTIGGSLCHADPAADWPTALTALDAAALLQSPAGARRVPIAALFAGPFATILARGEILTGVTIPRLAPGAGFALVKACRKPGEFAHAMAAALLARGKKRLVIGATGNRPLLLEGEAASIAGARAALAASAELDAVGRHMALAVAGRALAEAAACAA